MNLFAKLSIEDNLHMKDVLKKRMFSNKADLSIKIILETFKVIGRKLLTIFQLNLHKQIYKQLREDNRELYTVYTDEVGILGN